MLSHYKLFKSAPISFMGIDVIRCHTDTDKDS